MRKATTICDCCDKEEVEYGYFVPGLPSGWSDVGLLFDLILCRECTATARNVFYDWLKEQRKEQGK